MDNLTYIPINELYAHPDNPRKDLGDLSELADSIKENGVLQNLTVIKGHYLTSEECFALGAQYQESSSKEILEQMNTRSSSAGYTVVIGHRRLAAAKLAGLTELPCVVTEMTAADQVRTMLMENMQRSDLTVYEQAQGFQMMLDLGDTVETLAEKSGFSKSTVRRRVKLLALDQEKFKASVDRGATLQDYIELDKIEDLALKNEVLEAVGTNNFRSKLQMAIDREKNKKHLDTIVEALLPFASEITEVDYDTMRYAGNYGIWNKKVECPDDADTVKYFYKMGYQQVDLYRERTDEAANTEDEERRARTQAELERRKEGLREATARAFRLRRDFVSNYSTAKKQLPQIMKAAGNICFMADEGGLSLDYELMAELLGIDYDCENDEFPMDVYGEKMAERPEYTLLATLFVSMDEEENRYWGMVWKPELRACVLAQAENEVLDALYTFLQDLGYEMSDEEKALQDGTHELFHRDEPDKDDKEEADPCTLCKAAHPTCDECCATCEDTCNSGQTCRKQTED